MRLLFLLRYSFRSVRRSGRRALFAGICVTVGVAALVALQLATLTVQVALTSNIRANNGGDISVASTDSPLNDADLAVFKRLQASGQISAWTAVATARATAVGPAHALIPFEVNAVSVPPYPLSGDPTFSDPSNGHVASLLRRSGDVLITSVLADELGAHIGDTLFVNGLGGPGLRVTVRGILSETSFEHASAMTVGRRDLRALTNRPPRYTAVYANTNGNPAAVATVIRQRFPLATVQTVQEALQAAQAEVHDFRQFMLLVGLLALSIAGIGILNAMQSLLVWRRLEIAMLKAMGFQSATLYLIFGLEAALLGLAGGIVGTVLGAVGSKEISDALARALAVQVTFQLDVGTLLGGVGLGIGATLIFATLPIVRAAGLRPLELLREGAGVPPYQGAGQTLALLGLVLALFGILAASIMGDGVLAAEFVGGAALACAVLTGVFSALVGWIGLLGRPRSPVLGVAVLAGLALLIVLATRVQPGFVALLALAAVLWAATIFLPRSALVPLLIAVRSLSRRRARTSVTLVAFLVGVLAMSLTLTVAISLEGQINNALAQNSTSDLVAVATLSSEPAVLHEAKRLPGVKQHSVVIINTTTPIAINGQPVGAVIGPAPGGSNARRNREADELAGVAGIDLKRDGMPAGVSMAMGRALTPADRGTANVVGRTQLLREPWNLRLGDKVTLRDSASGLERTVRLVGFYRRSRTRSFGSFFLAPLLADQSFSRQLGGQGVQTVINFSIDPNSLTQDAATMQRAVPGILVVDIGDLTRIVDTVLGELLNLLVVITAIALGAGLAVVANGVALAMMERRREIALLKAIGFAPRNVLQFVLVENALAGTLAGAMSLLAIVTALAILSHLALNRAIGFDPAVATLILALATALAVVTAYLAARQPIRVRPVEALRND